MDRSILTPELIEKVKSGYKNMQSMSDSERAEYVSLIRNLNKKMRDPFELFDEEEDIEFNHLEIKQSLKKYEEEDLKHQS